MSSGLVLSTPKKLVLELRRPSSAPLLARASPPWASTGTGPYVPAVTLAGSPSGAAASASEYACAHAVRWPAVALDHCASAVAIAGSEDRVRSGVMTKS